MAMYRHGLYVIGAQLKSADDDVRTGALTVFAIERFVDAEFLKRQGFEIPEDSTVRSLLEGAFGPHLVDADGPHDVVVEFSAAKAHLVSSREWHPSQHITRVAGGGIRVELRVPSLAPLVSWVLEWGPYARVVAPLALIQKVSAELRGALSHYE
jgi:predicted DNA-binding transcriptional regulator YafY